MALIEMDFAMGVGNNEITPLDLINNFQSIWSGAVAYRKSQSITVSSKPKYLLAVYTNNTSILNSIMYLVDVENNRYLSAYGKSNGYNLSAGDGTGIFGTITDTTVSFTELGCASGNSSYYQIGAVF